MNKRGRGSFYEEVCVEYLIKNGFDILHRNYRCKLGEIDIIAKKDDIIRFIEVKFRGSGSYGSALEAVDFRKQRRIMRAASWFLNEYGLNDAQCSFDVMTVENNEARYYFNCYQIRPNPIVTKHRKFRLSN